MKKSGFVPLKEIASDLIEGRGVWPSDWNSQTVTDVLKELQRRKDEAKRHEG